MAKTTLFVSLPISVTPMSAKLSKTIAIKCVHCQYEGAAVVVTGRSPHPIYKCPQCNTVAQVIHSVGESA